MYTGRNLAGLLFAYSYAALFQQLEVNWPPNVALRGRPVLAAPAVLTLLLSSPCVSAHSIARALSPPKTCFPSEFELHVLYKVRLLVTATEPAQTSCLSQKRDP